jgi:hypothetical protein
MTVEWKIESLDRNTADGLVTTVHWRAVLAQHAHQVSVYGSHGLTPAVDQSVEFVPYDQLTPEVVIGWLHASWGETHTQDLVSQLESQMARLLEPQQASGLPW